MDNPLALFAKNTTANFGFGKATMYAWLSPLSPQCQNDWLSGVVCNPHPMPQETSGNVFCPSS